MARVFWIKELGKNSPHKLKIIYAGAFVLLVGLVVGGVYFFKKINSERETTPPLERSNQIILTPEETERVLKETSASATSTPKLTPAARKKVTKSTSAQPNEKPAIGDAERQKLIESMSAQ